MKKRILRSKIAEVILSLNEIILCESEETHGISALKKCRDDLEQVLKGLGSRAKTIDWNTVRKIVDCLAEYLLIWVRGGK